MGRFALTFWFTVTTLLGPGVCCCSFASALPHQAGGQSLASSTKSCCDHNATPGCPNGKHHEPGKPSKCPCEKGKQVKTLPPAGTTNADLAAQLKLIDALFVSLLLPYSLDFGAFTSATADTSQPVVRLAGRDLLAAYSLLRC